MCGQMTRVLNVWGFLGVRGGWPRAKPAPPVSGNNPTPHISIGPQPGQGCSLTAAEEFDWAWGWGLREKQAQSWKPRAEGSRERASYGLCPPPLQSHMDLDSLGFCSCPV